MNFWTIHFWKKDYPLLIEHGYEKIAQLYFDEFPSYKSMYNYHFYSGFSHHFPTGWAPPSYKLVYKHNSYYSYLYSYIMLYLPYRIQPLISQLSYECWTFRTPFDMKSPHCKAQRKKKLSHPTTSRSHPSPQSWTLEPPWSSSALRRWRDYGVHPGPSSCRWGRWPRVAWRKCPGKHMYIYTHIITIPNHNFYGWYRPFSNGLYNNYCCFNHIIYRSIYLSVCLSIYPSIYLSIYLSNYLIYLII